ncbi:MAG TPA: hypothetical protein VK590_00865 [Saprospiraceae bacterium]|nr:hypothetical protein [Saprospiraceae bacterium]
MQLLMEIIYEDIMDAKPVRLTISSPHGMDECAIPGASKEGPANSSMQ